MALFRNGGFAEDDWHLLTEEESLPLDGKVILSLALWDRYRDDALASNVPLGLQLEPARSAATIAKDISRFDLIAIHFPKFTDGRGYSQARQIRDFGFSGELRATGDILYDQLQLLARCGFDAFEITHAATIRLLETGRGPDLELFYQPSQRAEIPENTRPWARRAHIESAR
jgi:phosphoadenosine phosphosulfate reductase